MIERSTKDRKRSGRAGLGLALGCLAALTVLAATLTKPNGASAKTASASERTAQAITSASKGSASPSAMGQLSPLASEDTLEDPVKVLTIQLKNKNHAVKVPVYLTPYGYLAPKTYSVTMYTAGTDGSVSVSAIAHTNDIFDKDALHLSFPESIQAGETLRVEASLWMENSTYTTYIDLDVQKMSEKPAFESLSLSVGPKGFHPGKGNYLRVKGYIPDVTDGLNPADVTIQVLNSKEKCVFQKRLKDAAGQFVDYKWSGKASKNNEAKAKAGEYVKDGKYKVLITASLKLGDATIVSKKAKPLAVSSKAPAGEQGLSAARTRPILVGDPEVDYMAEQICKSAGVKSGMSADEKVRLIYHWMTKNQKHDHYFEGDKKYKSYYKLTSSATKKKVASYQKSVDKQLKAGTLLSRHDPSQAGLSWFMDHRVGVCDHSAAIFRVLCNHVGVEAGVCTGNYLNRNGTKSPHAWNYAIVDGKTYYYDIDVEMQNYGKGQGDYYWYKKTRAQANQTHEFATIEE